MLLTLRILCEAYICNMLRVARVSLELSVLDRGWVSEKFDHSKVIPSGEYLTIG